MLGKGKKKKLGKLCDLKKLIFKWQRHWCCRGLEDEVRWWRLVFGGGWGRLLWGDIIWAEAGVRAGGYLLGRKSFLVYVKVWGQHMLVNLRYRKPAVKSAHETQGQGAQRLVENRFFFFFWFCFLLFCFFKAEPAAYGNSLARSQIGAAVADLHHSHGHTRSSCICNLHCSSPQHQIL